MSSRTEPFGVTAQEAARLAGYRSVHQFRRAVARGVMPPPFDLCSRPQLWSVEQIKRACGGEPDEPTLDAEVRELDRRLGLL